ASDQLGDTGAVHDLVAEALLRVNQDRLAVERLALPFGERKLAVAADEIFLVSAQLEAFPAVIKMPVAQPAARQAVADVDVLQRLGALRLQAQRLLETRHRRGGSALLAQREPEGDERG